MSQAPPVWRRVHPITPVLKSWQFAVAMVVAVGQEMVRSWINRGSANREWSPTDSLPQAMSAAWQIVVGVVAIVLLGYVMWAWLSWRATRFAIEDDQLQYHSGVVWRQQRQVRLDRLQSVEITQPLIGRIVGLAAVVVESAGGSDSHVKLGYLTVTDAQAVRNAILAKASGMECTETDAPVASSWDFFSQPGGRLAGATVLHYAARLVGLVLLLAAAFGVWVWGVIGHRPTAAQLAPLLLGGLTVFGPAVLVTAVACWHEITNAWGTTLATSADGIRLRAGLLDTRSQTLPPGRIQAIGISQPMVWRPFGWWKLSVNIAGIGSADEATSGKQGVDHHTILPVAAQEDVLRTVSHLLQGEALARLEHLVHDGLTGRGRAGGWQVSPARAFWVMPFSFRRNGFTVSPAALWMRSGFWRRQLDLIPHERVQSIAITEGPRSRLLGLATFHAHSTPGPVRVRCRGLSHKDAALLLMNETARSRQARVVDRSDRWMQHVASASHDAASAHRDVVVLPAIHPVPAAPVHLPTARRTHAETVPSVLTGETIDAPATHTTTWSGSLAVQLVEPIHRMRVLQDVAGLAGAHCDPYAGVLIGEAVNLGVKQLPIETAARNLTAVRAIHLDEVVERSSAAHCVDVVCVGVGLDTRAFRMPKLARACVYEVDQPEVLGFKESVLEDAGAVPLSERIVVPSKPGDDWVAQVAEAGVSAQRRTLWLLEGFTIGNPDGVPNALLQQILPLCAPGSWICGELVPATHDAASFLADPCATFAQSLLAEVDSVTTVTRARVAHRLRLPLAEDVKGWFVTVITA